MQIRSGKVLPQDSGIGKSINLMKAIDEPLYDKLMAEYKKILKNINK
jgi:hypothetical protein